MVSDNDIISRWLEIRKLIDALELDIIKSAKGFHAPGVRARHRLRTLKENSHELILMLLEFDVIKRAQRQQNPNRRNPFAK